jgi:hypothetical protein
MNDRVDDYEISAVPLAPPDGPSDVYYRHRYGQLRDFYLQTDPAIWQEIEAQAARFADVAKTYIAPAMQEVADEASRRGWYSRIVYDDPHSVTRKETPRISLVLSRTPFPTQDTTEDPVGAVILYYGIIKNEKIILGQADADTANPNVMPTYLKDPIRYDEVSHDRFTSGMMELLDIWSEAPNDGS